MFKNPFSFEGRIRRLEYGISNLISIVVFYGVVTLAVFSGAESSLVTIVPLISIPICWFLLAQGAKRCHDRDNSGWYQIIPFYGFWMLFADGDIGRNEYGRNPKGIDFDPNDDYFSNGGVKRVDDVDGIIRGSK